MRQRHLCGRYETYYARTNPQPCSSPQPETQTRHFFGTGLDLNGLRAQEKELRDRLSSLGGCAQKDKDLLARRIAYIENLKAEIKKK